MVRDLINGELFASLPIINSQDVAPGTPFGVSTFLDSFVLTVPQQLPYHMRVSRSRPGPSKCHPEEGRVT
jgi:hypothetical protein